MFSPRFPSGPLYIIMRAPFLLLFGLNTNRKKGKRVLLGNLVDP